MGGVDWGMFVVFYPKKSFDCCVVLCFCQYEVLLPHLFVAMFRGATRLAYRPVAPWLVIDLVRPSPMSPPYPRVQTLRH